MTRAIVTGASSGIGKAIYEHLKERFDEVIGVSRHGPDEEVDLKYITGFYYGMTTNCLVNAAGIMPFEESKEVFDINFWAIYHLINQIGFESSSNIINIASVSGMIAEPDLPIYGASKAAVISLTKSYAKKFAPKVRVNCISPGFYKTNLVKGDTPSEMIQQVPMKYEDSPKNICPVVDMILDSNYMTGANIVIDGGVSL